jgi:hypothetical protein
MKTVNGHTDNVIIIGSWQEQEYINIITAPFSRRPDSRSDIWHNALFYARYSR